MITNQPKIKSVKVLAVSGCFVLIARKVSIDPRTITDNTAINAADQENSGS
ncbi:MAG: hypothetical protein K2Q13_01465 [Nitrosomonas sp.]|uniref:hypothetical protein n=1 Tax=Nitrosomonas sp. TaxID=42353 RepID=UPI0025F11017|nr:hypothetical protein [Nitrosomonas sp.]MBY0473710.1 hypothetical protein [Nitrosomonas sp.]